MTAQQTRTLAGYIPVECPPGRHPLGCPHTPAERAAEPFVPTWLRRQREQQQAKDLTGQVKA